MPDEVNSTSVPINVGTPDEDSASADQDEFDRIECAKTDEERRANLDALGAIFREKQRQRRLAEEPDRDRQET